MAHFIHILIIYTVLLSFRNQDKCLLKGYLKVNKQLRQVNIIILGFSCKCDMTLGKRKRHYPRTNWRPVDGYHSESEADSVPYRSSCQDKPSNQNNAPGDEQDAVSDKQTSKCEVTMTDGYSSEGEVPKDVSPLEIAAQNQPSQRDKPKSVKNLSQQDEGGKACGYTREKTDRVRLHGRVYVQTYYITHFRKVNIIRNKN